MEIGKAYREFEKDDLLSIIDTDTTKYNFEFKYKFIDIFWYLKEKRNDRDSFADLIKNRFNIKYNEDIEDLVIGDGDVKWDDAADDFILDNVTLLSDKDNRTLNEDVCKYLFEYEGVAFKVVGFKGDSAINKFNHGSSENIIVCKTTKAMTFKEFINSFANSNYLTSISQNPEDILQSDIDEITFINANE